MAREPKKKVAFTLSPVNYEWLQGLSASTGVSMSLFIDSFLSGARLSRQGSNDQEAMKMALEQIAKGIRK